MTDGPTLSVRAQAVRTISPDLVRLSGAIETRARRKADAVAEAGSVQRQVIAALEALGGRSGRAGEERMALSWLTRSVNTHPEQEYDPVKQQMRPTGHVIARVGLEIRVRDFDLLERVDAALVEIDTYSSYGAQWSVDPDNPAWRGVRADAISDALRQADDYAAALGCAVSRVEQVADAGLLAETPVGMPVAAAMALSRSGPAGPPALDPEPQQVSATIDVRCATQMLTS